MIFNNHKKSSHFSDFLWAKGRNSVNELKAGYNLQTSMAGFCLLAECVDNYNDELPSLFIASCQTSL